MRVECDLHVTQEQEFELRGDPTSARTCHTLCICAMVKDVYLCRHCLFSLTRKLLLLHLMTPQFVGGVV